MKKLFLFAGAILAAISCEAQWEPDVRLTYDQAVSYTPYSSGVHAVAASGDTIHIVWYDNRDGNYEIYYKHSYDGGLTWSQDIRLTYNVYDSKYPTILVSGSNVHVVWADNRDGNFEIYYKNSFDGGNIWGTDIRVTYTIGNTWHPCLTISDSILHMVYYDQANNWWEIYYQRSTDNGLTWEQPIRLTNDPAGSSEPSICTTGSVLNVVWLDFRDGNSEIYYKRSADKGINWDPDIRLTNNDSSSLNPCVAASDSCVHVVWQDKRDGNYEIYYKRSCDGGNTWCEDTRLTNNSGNSTYPNLAASGTGLFVTWVDDRDSNLEIYYKSSMDEGLTWGPDVRLTNDTAESNHPYISVSDSLINVIWYDARDGNYEIYYKRNPTGGFPVCIGKEKGNIPGQQITVYPNPAKNVLNIKFEPPPRRRFTLKAKRLMIIDKHSAMENFLQKIGCTLI